VRIFAYLDNDSILTVPASPVDKFPLDPAILVKMRYLVQKNKAAGLSAPQVGIGQRFFVLARLGPAVINPEVEVYGTEVELRYEGCLSFPWRDVEIPRSTVVRVKYQTERGLSVVETFSGHLARVVQHEIEHLNGRGLWDYVK
jgi:peptide deformylase